MSTRQTWALLSRRIALRRSLNEKVEVWRTTGASDGMGGVTSTLARVATYPGKVEPVTERNRLWADRLGQVASAVLVLPHDASVQPADEFRVDGRAYTYVGSDAGTTDAVATRVAIASVR